MGSPLVCQSCSDRVELFKLKDEVWAQSGFATSAWACIGCVEKGLGRPLSPADIDRNFPWWTADRPEYYVGLTDGMDLKPRASEEKLYVFGHELGSRIAGNRQFVFAMPLNDDSPVIFKVNVATYTNYELVQSQPTMNAKDDYDVLAIIDTGSRQCLMIPGLFADRHFGNNPPTIDMFGSDGRGWHCRGRQFWITLKSGNRTKTIEVPIYEQPFGSWPAGTLIIGRNVLDQAVFTYNGISKFASLTFPDAEVFKLDALTPA